MAELLLEVVEGEQAGTELPLSAELELGRDDGLPQPLRDEQVSRRHARVTPSGSGAVIDDLGSTNGTYVNDQPISGTHALRPGDRIRVGLTVLELRTAEQATVRGSAVRRAPPVTRIGADLLRPASPHDLAPVREDVANLPALLVEEDEPAFIRESAVGAALGHAEASAGGESHYDALARLVDTRVKRQTSAAAVASLAIAALAVAIFFGVR